MDFSLTKEHRQAILAAVYNTEKLGLERQALSEDIKAIAAKIGCKPSEVSSMVSVVIAERAKGGVILAKERSLELARQILDEPAP